MKVYLLSHTPEPEILVAGAAKLCYSNAEISGLMGGIDEQKAAEFLDMLGDLGHQSPTEHASFTFAVEGVSRSLLAQLTRHRIASYSVQSQRYVKLGGFEYVTPPAIAADPESSALYQKAMARAAEQYEALADTLQAKYYAELLAEGKSEKAAKRAAEKRAIEDARFVLPNACTTKLVMTMNARSLQNFFDHRCCNRAQWEIQQLADEMLRLVQTVAPALFKNSGPPCVHGACPEGKMSCGRRDEMREKYARLKEEAKP